MDNFYLDQAMDELDNIYHNINNITDTINTINEHINEYQNHLNQVMQIPFPEFNIPNELVAPPPIQEAEERTIMDDILAAEEFRQNEAAFLIQRAWSNFSMYL